MLINRAHLQCILFWQKHQMGFPLVFIITASADSSTNWVTKQSRNKQADPQIPNYPHYPAFQWCRRQRGVHIVFQLHSVKTKKQTWKCVTVHWLPLFSVNRFLSKNKSAIKMDAHLHSTESGREPQPAASSHWEENPSENSMTWFQYATSIHCIPGSICYFLVILFIIIF